MKRRAPHHVAYEELTATLAAAVPPNDATESTLDVQTLFDKAHQESLDLKRPLGLAACEVLHRHKLDFWHTIHQAVCKKTT